jgi:hypothetical protein
MAHNVSCCNCSETVQMVHSITFGSRIPSFKLCFTSRLKGILTQSKYIRPTLLFSDSKYIMSDLLTFLTVFQHLSYKGSGYSPW